MCSSLIKKNICNEYFTQHQHFIKKKKATKSKRKIWITSVINVECLWIYRRMKEKINKMSTALWQEQKVVISIIQGMKVGEEAKLL